MLSQPGKRVKNYLNEFFFIELYFTILISAQHNFTQMSEGPSFWNVQQTKYINILTLGWIFIATKKGFLFAHKEMIIEGHITILGFVY